MRGVGYSELDKGSVTFERHLIFRRQKKKNWKKGLLVGLMLTSMVDMFSMLVCFMLQTFSSTPEVLITKGLELPTSLTPSMVKEAPVISISKEGVFFDQKLVGDVQKIMRRPGLLTGKLISARKAWAKANPGKAFDGEINLQADREISSAVVSKFMGILTSQHYSSIQLAVVSTGGL